MTKGSDPEAEGEHLEASTYDHVDQLLLVLDQLAVCRDLLVTERPAHSRMALILLDNLADVLIYRHNRQVIRGAQDRFARRRFNKKQRIALQNSFEERLRLAQESTELSFTSSGPLIGQDDVRVLRVVHFYRNSAYHRDSHKPALVGVLARILFLTVCRMAVESYAPGSGYSSSSPIFAKQIERLNTFLDPPGIDLAGYETLKFRDRVEQATAGVSKTLHVELPAATTAFSEDLEFRANAALKLAEDLVGEGLSEEDIREGIGWAAFWECYDGDAQLIRFLDETRSLRGKSSGADRDRAQEQIRAAEENYSERIRLLRQGFRPQVSLDYIDEAKEAAGRMAGADSLAQLLEEYEQADRKMTALENYLWEVAAEWDRHLDIQFQEWKETHRHEPLNG